jgi:hypothetical protein
MLNSTKVLLLAAVDADSTMEVATASVLPSGLRSFLEQRVPEEEEESEAAVAAAVATKAGYYSEAYRKRLYNPEEVEERKKVRTDRKEGLRLKAMLEKEQKAEQKA